MIDSGLIHLLTTLGYVAVALFVGVESLGVPFPGETMLITASVFAGGTHQLSIAGVIAAAAAGAIVGNLIGFGIGWFGGYALLRRFGRFIRLDESSLKVGRYIFQRQGAKVVFFGRFVAILRTYAAFLAGVNRMDPRRFAVFSVAGGVCWAALWGVVAYVLGAEISRVGTALEITFGIIGGLLLILSILFVRSHVSRLREVAERAHPGPLEGFSD
ncbi:MAG: DedA family protein [Candidatus Dormibacteraeota bacterium]|nr:DedA family protein [Candidatus Dormibacteraeota bacterium]